MKHLVLIVAVALAASACSRGETMEQRPQERSIIKVGVASVQGIDEPITIEATGSFEADESSDVAPEASGRVVATPVDVGQYVREGALLDLDEAK